METGMLQILAGVALVIFAAFWLTAVIALFAFVVYAVKAIRCARPGVNLWGRDTLWNPANVLLGTNLLTDEGQQYRRRCFKSLGIFTALVGGTLLVAAISGQLK
jgi:hypothetical protein